MVTNNRNFFFIQSTPTYGSFALILVDGEVPTTFPEELKKLMPGSLPLEEIRIEQDDECLVALQKHKPEWFQRLDKVKVETMNGVKYQTVIRYASV